MIEGQTRTLRQMCERCLTLQRAQIWLSGVSKYERSEARRALRIYDKRGPCFLSDRLAPHFALFFSERRSSLSAERPDDEAGSQSIYIYFLQINEYSYIPSSIFILYMFERLRISLYSCGILIVTGMLTSKFTCTSSF